VICADNAGENQVLERLLKQEGLGVNFEYSAPNTPQQNGQVERRFATLYGRVRDKLKSVDTKKLWAKACNTATDLSNVLVKPRKDTNFFHKFLGRDLNASSMILQKSLVKWL